VVRCNSRYNRYRIAQTTLEGINAKEKNNPAQYIIRDHSGNNKPDLLRLRPVGVTASKQRKTSRNYDSSGRAATSLQPVYSRAT
jgi:hypothetical protein